MMNLFPICIIPSPQLKFLLYLCSFKTRLPNKEYTCLPSPQRSKLLISVKLPPHDISAPLANSNSSPSSTKGNSAPITPLPSATPPNSQKPLKYFSMPPKVSSKSPQKYNLVPHDNSPTDLSKYETLILDRLSDEPLPLQ